MRKKTYVTTQLAVFFMSDNRYVYCLYLYRFLKGSAAEEACAAVASAEVSNPLLMTELDLSKRILEALGVTQLCALLEDSHCTLQKLRLVDAVTFSSVNKHQLHSSFLE